MDGTGVHESATIIRMALDGVKNYQRTLVAAIDAEIGVRRWSRARLAKEAGITSQTLDRIFLLRRDMNIEQLGDIAAALGVTPEYLVHSARVWSERITHDDLVDQSAELSPRQKAALKSDIAQTTSNRGNNDPSGNDVRLPPVRSKRPAG